MTAPVPPVDLDQLAAALANGLPWRVGEHYGIHLYAGQSPVGTTLRASDAAAIVAAVNASGALIAELRDLRAKVAAVEALAGEEAGCECYSPNRCPIHDGMWP